MRHSPDIPRRLRVSRDSFRRTQCRCLKICSILALPRLSLHYVLTSSTFSSAPQKSSLTPILPLLYQFLLQALHILRRQQMNPSTWTNPSKVYLQMRLADILGGYVLQSLFLLLKFLNPFSLIATILRILCLVSSLSPPSLTALHSNIPLPYSPRVFPSTPYPSSPTSLLTLFSHLVLFSPSKHW